MSAIKVDRALRRSMSTIARWIECSAARSTRSEIAFHLPSASFQGIFGGQSQIMIIRLIRVPASGG